MKQSTGLFHFKARALSGFESLLFNKKRRYHSRYPLFLALTPNFNTIISSGAFTFKEKFHGETFLFSIKKVI